MYTCIEVIPTKQLSGLSSIILSSDVITLNKSTPYPRNIKSHFFIASANNFTRNKVFPTIYVYIYRETKIFYKIKSYNIDKIPIVGHCEPMPEKTKQTGRSLGPVIEPISLI